MEELEKKNLIINAIANLPGAMYKNVRSRLVASDRNWLVGQADLRRFTLKKVYKDDVNSHSIVRKTKGLYPYEYFNICFLNDMLQFVLDTVMEDGIPYIAIENSSGVNIWEMFFKQPYIEAGSLPEDNVVEAEEKDAKVFASFEDIFSDEMIYLWGNIYRRYVHFNDKTKRYIKNELQDIFGENRQGKVLGVLVRGTDYVHLKPKGHPVQPEVETVINDARKMMDEEGYEYLYLATEDGRIDKAFREVFGDKLLINQRKYYDEIYSGNDIELIKDVHFDRKDDDYYKGVEYLSSLVILSKCDSLIAGNCGGTQAAVFMNRLNYKNCQVYNLGIY